MARETWVQSQVESYQRLKKWYLMPPCLTLSIIRYGSRVKWRNPGKGVAPSPTPWCSSYWKGSLRVTFNYGRQLYLHIYIYTYRERGRVETERKILINIDGYRCVYAYIMKTRTRTTHIHVYTSIKLGAWQVSVFRICDHQTKLYIYIYIYITAIENINRFLMFSLSLLHTHI